MRLLACALALPLLLAAPSRAQLEPGALPIERARIGGLEVARVRPDGVRDALKNPRLPALALEGSRREWEAEPQVLERVQDWARRGGIVILHTDAAQAFGFRTVRARGRTRERAGELFGRARSALHFGLHPLLWGGLSQSSEGAAFGSLGVRLVFYRMEPGDVLAMSHPDGVPILRATDLAQPVADAPRARGGGPIEKHAVALAPFGRGWALLMPRLIESGRADGQRFEQNIARLVRSLASKSQVGAPTPPIERAYDRWKRGRRIDWARGADEMRRGVADEEVEASPRDVAQVLARDSDQTLSEAAVDARFGPVRRAARDAREADYFFAIASSMESAKRRRLLFLAHSRFRLILPQSELERTLSAFDQAARDQAANQLQAEKLPIEEGEAPTNDAPDGAEEAIDEEAFASDGGADEIGAGEPPMLEDERRFPSYRAACARMFVLRSRIVALRAHRARPNTGSWSVRARRVGLEAREFWMWRGVLAAGEADETGTNSWIRSLTLGDAAASWQRALAAPSGRAVEEGGQGGGSAFPTLLQLLGGEAETATREAALAAQAAAQAPSRARGSASGAKNLKNPGAQVLEAPESEPQAAGGDVCGVPREVVEHWIAGSLAAHRVLARDAPLGASVESSRTESIKPWIPVLMNLNGGAISTVESDRKMLPLAASLINKLPDIPRRGWLEDATTLSWYRAATGTSPPQWTRPSSTPRIELSTEPVGPPDLPSSNDARPKLIAQAALTLKLHSGACAFGWRADAEDITMCPSVGAMRSLSKGILAAGALGAAHDKAVPNGAGRRGGDPIEDGILLQLEREKQARVRAALPPRLALAGVRYMESANTGMALGTRILIPTAPDPPQHGFQRGLEKRQIRMMIGIPTALARAHADVLINTITEGGTAPPPWMREGFASASRQYMARAMSDKGFLTNSFFQAIPFGFHMGTTKHGWQTNTHHNALEGAEDPDANEHDIWWSGDDDYFNTCSQLAVLGLPESAGTHLLPRLYAEVGSGGVTEIMQRLGSGASADEAFGAVTGRGVDEWAARQMGQRGRR